MPIAIIIKRCYHIGNSDLPKRDNIYIDDAVNGLLLICTKGVRGEAYNISSNGDLDNFAAVDEIAEAVAKVANEEHGKNAKVKYDNPSTKPRGAGVKLDNEKLRGLGFTLELSMEKGIRETIHRYTNAQ